MSWILTLTILGMIPSAYEFTFMIMFMSIYSAYAPLHMSYVDLLDILGVSQCICFIILYVMVYFINGPWWTRVIVIVQCTRCIMWFTLMHIMILLLWWNVQKIECMIEFYNVLGKNPEAHEWWDFLVSASSGIHELWNLVLIVSSWTHELWNLVLSVSYGAHELWDFVLSISFGVHEL